MSDLTPEEWERIQTVIESTLPADDAERKQELCQLFDGDERLAAAAEEYIQIYKEETESDFLETPVRIELASTAPGHTAAGLGSVPQQSRISEIYGPYRAMEKISEGGMGAVYKAISGTDFRQVAALKLIRRDVVSDEVVARFHNERKILAELEHDHIARLYGGGETPEGVPYFAMEFIDGTAIDRYCDEHRLSVEERLEIFLPICSAVEAAHNHLVVHRDLKPANILVTAEGVAKLLDFGIARPLEHHMMAQTVNTVAGRTPMTVRYASPEMIRGKPVGTSSDVYALGVVLYELLTGRLPCGLDNLSQAQCFDAIRETDPQPLSSIVLEERKLLRSNGMLQTTSPEEIARLRSTESDRLSQSLYGDLDAILLKALAKDPKDRYGSVREMADDLRLHLEGRPVQARQLTFLYSAEKFIRRNRLAVATATLVFTMAAAVVFLLVEQYQINKENLEFKENALVSQIQAMAAIEQTLSMAEEDRDFLESIFESVQPNISKGEDTTARSLLDHALKELLKQLQHDAPRRGGIHLEILARSYGYLGDFETARRWTRRAIDFAKQEEQTRDEDLAMMYHNLAEVCLELNDDACTEEAFEAALEIRRNLKQSPISFVRTLMIKATLLKKQGRFDEASELYRTLVQVRAAKYGEDSSDLTAPWLGVGVVEYLRGDFDEAAKCYQKALDLQTADDPKHLLAASAYNSLGQTYMAQELYPAAEEALKKGLNLRLELLHERHDRVLGSRINLTSLYLRQHRIDEAAAELGIIENIFQPDDAVKQAEILGLRGELKARKKQYQHAEPLLLESHEVLSRLRAPNATPVCRALLRVLDLYEEWERPEEAAPYHETLSNDCPWAQRKVSMRNL